MGFGKPNRYGQSLGHMNLADSLKWRDCAVKIPDLVPADGAKSTSPRSGDKARRGSSGKHSAVEGSAWPAAVPTQNYYLLQTQTSVCLYRHTRLQRSHCKENGSPTDLRCLERPSDIITYDVAAVHADGLGVAAVDVDQTIAREAIALVQAIDDLCHQ